jgi:hypothetical protein
MWTTDFMHVMHRGDVGWSLVRGSGQIPQVGAMYQRHERPGVERQTLPKHSRTITPRSLQVGCAQRRRASLIRQLTHYIKPQALQKPKPNSLFIRFLQKTNPKTNMTQTHVLHAGRSQPAWVSIPRRPQSSLPLDWYLIWLVLSSPAVLLRTRQTALCHHRGIW